MLRTVLKQASGLGLGTVIGQGLVLAGTPLLVRIYGPASFGVLALVMTATNISVATGCARFDLALPSADDDDVPGLAWLCTLVGATAAMLAALAAMVASAWLSPGGAWGEIVHRPLLVASSVFFPATYQAASSVLLRHNRIRAMAMLRASQGAIFLALALIQGVGLLWAQALSFAPGCLFLAAALVRLTGVKTTIGDVATRYRSFALLGLPGAVLDVVGYSLCIWIVTAAYGTAGSGELSQVQRIVGAPLMLVSMSLGQILLRQSVALRDDLPRLRQLVLRLIGLLGAGAFGALVLIALVGERFMDLFLGGKWDVSTGFIVALFAAVFVRAAISPVSVILATFRRFDLALRWQLLYFVSAISLFSLASHTLSLTGFVAFYAVHEAVLYLVYFRVIMSVFRKV